MKAKADRHGPDISVGDAGGDGQRRSGEFEADVEAKGERIGGAGRIAVLDPERDAVAAALNQIEQGIARKAVFWHRECIVAETIATPVEQSDDRKEKRRVTRPPGPVAIPQQFVAMPRRQAR